MDFFNIQLKGRAIRNALSVGIGRLVPLHSGFMERFSCRHTAGHLAWANQRGGVLLVLLVLISLLGVGMLAAGQSWKDRMQRERETELLWRGTQYRQAIGRYYRRQAAGLQGQFPLELEELVSDKRGVTVAHHLRRLYPDPFTGQGFVPVRGPNGRIRGVRSGSQLKPFKQGGFSEAEEGFSLAENYSEWAFVFRPEDKAKSDKKAERQASQDPPPDSTQTSPAGIAPERLEGNDGTE